MKIDLVGFELLVMDMAEPCETCEELEWLAETLQIAVETAIEDVCMDKGIIGTMNPATKEVVGK